MADKGRQLGVPVDKLLQNEVLADTTETGETSNVSKTEALTRKALVALLALGAVVVMPKESSAYSLVTADSSGKIHVIMDAQDKDGEVTPEITYEVPMAPGSQIGQVEVLNDDKIAVTINNQNATGDVLILTFDGNNFAILSSTHFSELIYNIEATPDGNILVAQYGGMYKFSPDAPEDTLEELVATNDLFNTSASFIDANGNECHIVSSGDGILRIIADMSEGGEVMEFPIPSGMFSNQGIIGIDIDQVNNEVVLSDGVRVYAGDFDVNNPTIDFDTFMLIDQAQEDGINTATHTGDGFATLEGGGLMDFINNGNTARDTLDVGSNNGFVQYDTNGDGVDNTFFVRGGMGWNSVTVVDGNSKDVTKNIGNRADWAANNGLAVVSGAPELEAMTSVPPIGNLHIHENGPSYTTVEGPEENSVEITADISSLANPGDSFSIPFLSVLNTGPEHSVYLNLTYNTIVLGASIDPIILENPALLDGTGGWFVFSNEGGDITVKLVLGADGRPGISDGTFAGETAVEGGASGENVASASAGSYDEMKSEATGESSGDDDDATEDVTPADDDDDRPGGGGGCSIRAGETTNLGSLVSLLAVAGVSASRRRKDRRRAARKK